jgi:hypothetical protein
LCCTVQYSRNFLVLCHCGSTEIALNSRKCPKIPFSGRSLQIPDGTELIALGCYDTV